MNRLVLVVVLFFLAGCHLHIGGEPQPLMVNAQLDMRAPLKGQLTVFTSGPLEKGLVYFTTPDFPILDAGSDTPKIRELLLPFKPNEMTVRPLELPNLATLVLYFRGPEDYGWLLYKIRDGQVEAEVRRTFSR